MIKIEKTAVFGLEDAIRGMRNPMDSWDRSDSKYIALDCYEIGPKDRDLAERLIASGPEHATFLRFIQVWCDITAPRFWWQEMDRYRVGKEQISCSTMHKLMSRKLRPEDFTGDVFPETLDRLNSLMDGYSLEKDEAIRKALWRQIIENLPQGYNQRRTVMMSYQTLRSIVHQRKGHKLTEWHDFIDWAKGLPESWMLFVE